MNATNDLREQVKKSIDIADDVTVKMVHAMLKIKEESDWWDELPGSIRSEADKALKELDAGEGIPHEKVKEMYSQWFKK